MSIQPFGKYQLLRKLATGGMAEVWLARQTGIEGFQRQLVIKRILPHLAEDQEFVQMFLNEAKISAKFSHPSIGSVYELGTSDGTYYLAMEYIHGEDLGRVMRKAWSTGQWIARPLAMRIVAHACEGLYYAHTRLDDRGQPLRVVHRDISPQNILISFDGAVKVVDFGIAKAANHTSMTRSGAIKGKFAYMSPEQAAGKNLDHRSDIFAVGLVLYELLTGVRPLKRESELATLQAALECNIDAPSQVADVPSELDGVVMRALSRNVNERYDDARQFQLALEEFLVSQRWVAGSVQLAELMSTLFADRLLEEAKATASGEVAELSGSTDQASGAAPRMTPKAGDMSWDAPPGEMADGRRSPKPIAKSSMARVVAPDVPGWEAPAGELDASVRRRSHDSVRAAESTSLARGGPPPSRTEVPKSGSPRRSGSPATASAMEALADAEESLAPTEHEETRARPATNPVLARGSKTQLPATRARQALEEDPDAAEPREENAPLEEAPERGSAPRRRPTGVTANPATNWRIPSRLEMPDAPPASRRFEDSEVSEESSDSYSRSRLGIGGRDRLRSLGRGVVVLAVAGALTVTGYLYRKPAADLAKHIIDSNNVPGMGQPIYIKAQSNLPVRVTVRHNEPNPVEAETVLGETPLDHASGAHIADTIVFENKAYAAHYEERLEFGQPGETKLIRKEFATGYALPQFKNVPPGSQLSFWNGNALLGNYVPNLKLVLVEGEYHLEIRGDVLREAVPITVKVVANKTTPTVFVDLKRHLEQK